MMTIQWWTRFWCGLRGHDFIICREPNKLSLKCLNCLHNTEGVSIK